PPPPPPGRGVDVLRDRLAGAVQRRAAATRRLLSDIAESAQDVRAGLADSEPDLDIDEALPGLTTALADTAGVPLLVQAVRDSSECAAVAAGGWPVARWVRRLRPTAVIDPVFTPVGAGGAPDDPEDAVRRVRSSLPPPSDAQRSRVELATRRLVDAVARDLPEGWARAARNTVRSPDGDLVDTVDQAVLATDLPLDRPPWWSTVKMAQAGLTMLALLGLVWLTLVVVQVLEPSAGAPVLPAVLVVIGFAGGALLDRVVRKRASQEAADRTAAARHQLEATITQIVRDRMADPLRRLLEDHRRAREAAQRAAR
ncbi:MAG: hypothetical protein ACRC35_00270, partial [Angustibacter sp.]